MRAFRATALAATALISRTALIAALPPTTEESAIPRFSTSTSPSRPSVGKVGIEYNTVDDAHRPITFTMAGHDCFHLVLVNSNSASPTRTVWISGTVGPRQDRTWPARTGIRSQGARPRTRNCMTR